MLLQGSEIQRNMFLLPPKPEVEYFGLGLLGQIMNTEIVEQKTIKFDAESFFDGLSRQGYMQQEYPIYCSTEFAYKIDEQLKSYWIYEKYRGINPHRHPAGVKIGRRVIKELRSYK